MSFTKHFSLTASQSQGVSRVPARTYTGDYFSFSPVHTTHQCNNYPALCMPSEKHQ